jgi:GH15 family glucan-1,4-alpha-glucosidase
VDGRTQAESGTTDKPASGTTVTEGAPVSRYQQARSEIGEAIETEGSDASAGTYLAAPGDLRPDATLLLLPIYGYCPAGSPRMRRAYERVRGELGAGEGLFYRYRRGEETPGEGAFGICSFWAVQYLADGGGSLGEAEELFTQMLERASDLGLYAEEVDPRTGDALGNFPQAFSHIGVINAALALEARAARERGEALQAQAQTEALTEGGIHL